MSWRLIRHTVNIGVLFSALVIAPLMTAAHFSVGLAEMLGEFAGTYLPQSTVLATEQGARRADIARERARRVEEAGKRGRVIRETRARRGDALNKGSRILVRGSAAMAVGMVPLVGLSADIYSLAEDYNDVCALLRIIDEMSASLGVQDESLYRLNYCHKPDEGMALLRQQADQFAWP